MDQARQVFRNTAMLGVARLIERASTVLVSFFVARILHATGLGDYATALVLHELFTVSAQMGSTNLLVREIGKSLENTSRYFVHLAAMSASLALILMVLLWAALPHLGYSTALVSVLSLVLFAVVPGTLISLQEGVFVAHQRTEFVTLTTAIAAVINIAISLILLMQGYGVESLVVAFVVVQWTVMSLYFIFVHRYISALRWKFELDFARKLLGEIKTFAGISFVAALFSRPEIIILSLFSSEAQIGFYSAALKVISVLEYIPQIYMTNVFPILSRAYHRSNEQVQDIQNQSIKYLLAISLPLAVGLFVTAEPVIRLLYGPGFEASALALRILTFDLPFAALYAVLWRVLVARQEQGVVLRAMIIVTLTELVAGYVLISRWASIGAAVNTPLISMFYVCLLALSLKSNGIQLFFLRFGWRFAVSAIGMGILLSVIGRTLELWALVPLGVLTYASLVILFRAFSAEDIAVFRTFRQPRMATKSQIDE